MTLDDVLREAAAKGLSHLSLWPVHSEDRKTIYWTCRATPSTMHSYVQAQGKDPVEVTLEVLKGLPKAPKRSTNKIKLTETVSPDENIGSTDWSKPETTIGEIDKPEEPKAKPKKKGGLNPEWGI